jgi:hypothetical protein
MNNLPVMAFNKKLKIVFKLLLIFVLYILIRYVNESDKSTNIADCEFFTKYVNLDVGWLNGTGDYFRQTLKSSCHTLDHVKNNLNSNVQHLYEKLEALWNETEVAGLWNKTMEPLKASNDLLSQNSDALQSLLQTNYDSLNNLFWLNSRVLKQIANQYFDVFKSLLQQGANPLNMGLCFIFAFLKIMLVLLKLVAFCVSAVLCIVFVSFVVALLLMFTFAAIGFCALGVH